MSSLAMSSFVEQQIVLHQFTAKHSVQARAMLGWSQEDLARQAGVAVEAIQQFESQRDVGDETRLALAFRLEAEGLVFFPGFAPGWGMSVRRFDAPSGENLCRQINYQQGSSQRQASCVFSGSLSATAGAGE